MTNFILIKLTIFDLVT